MNNQKQNHTNTGSYIKDVPGGVKMIAVLNYIGFGFFALISLLLLILGVILVIVGGSSLIEDASEGGYDLLMIMGGVGLIFFYLFIIGFSVLLFFIGRGLWKLKNLARIACIVLAGIMVLYGLRELVNGIIVSEAHIILFGLIIMSFNGIIGGYLFFNRRVKKAFKGN